MWIYTGLEHAFQMFWEVWWALVLGFALSGIVQAWVPRRRLEDAFLALVGDNSRGSGDR